MAGVYGHLNRFSISKIFGQTMKITHLLDAFPQTDSFTLYDGTHIKTPFHFSGSSTLIYGLIDWEEARKFVNNHDFEPILIPAKQKYALGVVYLQFFEEGSAGPYNEIINGIMVKKKGAVDLDIPALDIQWDLREKSEYIGGVLSQIGQANKPFKESGSPQAYATYHQALELDGQLGVDAGLEMWGYPKILSDFSVDRNKDSVAVAINELGRDREVVSIRYVRDDRMKTKFFMKGDTVLPDERNPFADKLAQVPGILATRADTLGHIQDFQGEFKVGRSNNLLAQALRQTKFEPVAIYEVTQAQGVSFDSYPK